MKAFYLLLLAALAILPSAISPDQKRYYTKAEFQDAVFQDFLQKYDQFEAQLSLLKEMTAGSDPGEIQAIYRQLRIYFKQIEPLFSYYMENEYNLYFNGAPLPKLEPNVPEITVLEPKGMQVIDEIIYGDLEEQREELYEQINDLEKAAAKTKKILRAITVRENHVLEACRSSLVRLTALGLSGFDTPGSALFVQDALTVTKEMEHLVSFLRPYMESNDLEIFEAFERLRGKLALYSNNDEVDFVDLIRNDISPLYKAIKDFHLRSGIEHAREVSNREAPLNYYADHIFSEEFLNLSPFSRIDKNEQRPEGVELGKMLFFDPVMSRNWSSSCASCHDPNLAFTDGKEKSIASNGKELLMRNSPTLINSIYSRKFFHDMRAVKPSLQVDHVVYNPDEFNIDYVEISERLKSSPEYREMFERAFPHLQEKINRYSITNAITQYVASLVGMDSEFDRYMRRETAKIDPSVYKGFNLFMGKGACASCHFVPVFNGTVPPAYQDSESEILGVLAINDFENPVLDNDPGRMKNGDVRQESEIYYRSFKTPTIRNAALTAPYLHNGVHQTLEEVMRFYNAGGGLGMGLDVPYQTLPSDSLHLSEEEIQYIISFMQALTDTSGMTSRPILPSIPGYEQRSIQGY